jgi:hypothetical protein
MADSDSTRLRMLLECEEMCDRKLFQFYQDFKKLASSSTQDDFNLTLWKNRLPVHVQHVLVVLKDTKTENLKRVANRIQESCPKKERVPVVEIERTSGEQQNCGSDQMQGFVE